MGFTKGEWKVLPEGNEWVVGDDGFAIAKVLDGAPRFPRNVKANAHLIAAAPAMYEALKELLADYDPQEHWNTAIDKGLKALSLADG